MSDSVTVWSLAFMLGVAHSYAAGLWSGGQIIFWLFVFLTTGMGWRLLMWLQSCQHKIIRVIYLHHLQTMVVGMRKTLCICGVAILIISACVTVQPPAIKPPTAEMLTNADYGDKPEEFQELARQAIGAQLLDPYSAMYENWRGPVKNWVVEWGRYTFGWAVCVDVNAKNRMGGYTGRKPYFVFIRNSSVWTVWNAEKIGGLQVEGACSGVSYLEKGGSL